MQNRTVGIIATAVAAFICGCAAILTCVWGVLIVSGRPIDVTTDAGTTQQTISPAIGAGLLCLSLILILIPVTIGFFTLRKKPEAAINELPPTS